MGGFFSKSYRAPLDDGRVKPFHTLDEWQKHLKSMEGSTQLMVIDFAASWCGPCQFMVPIVIKLAATYTDVIFVKIDVDELREVAQEYGVEAMPTFILIKEGKEVDKVIGADRDELESKIEKHRGLV